LKVWSKTCKAEEEKLTITTETFTYETMLVHGSTTVSNPLQLGDSCPTSFDNTLV